MKPSQPKRKLLILVVILALVLVGVAIVLTAQALSDGNRLREPLARELSRHTGRLIRIEGPLRAHLLTLHPHLVAEGVIIGNPPWVAPGTMARIGKLTVTLDVPWPGHTLALRELQLDGLDLHLQRDAEAHANWYWKAPGTLPGKGAPLIHSLSMPDAHVVLEDERRHLSFDGTVSIGDSPGPLGIEVKGHLNTRDFQLTAHGDPLATTARDQPYHFKLEERSSGSTLTAQGAVAQPFDFRAIDATFQAHGADLKDLYFLLGVTLPDTGPYRLAGKLTRRYTNFTLSDVVTRSGQSDIRMTLTSHLFASGKSHVEVELDSQRLRISDLGARAAGRSAEGADSKPLLLPDSPIPLEGVRRTNSVIDFRIQELDAGKLSFHQVSGAMSVDYGVLTMPRLSAALPDGTIRAHGGFDARPDRPTLSLDMEFADIRLSQLIRKNPTRPVPIEGPLYGHVALSGRGRSIHELASDASGTVTAVLPEGVMRASLAELAATNLRGLQMLLARSEREAPVRCALASFQARNGTFVARKLMIDTDRMLITGEGEIRFGGETLDLRVHGEPKGVRLIRLSAPVTVQGTLAHPVFGVEKHDRKLELIDPGHGKDVDCATLLAEARTGGVPISASAAVPPEREPSTK